MSALTEDIVLARTRNRQVADVKTIKLCAFGLSDVSIFEQMPQLEIANLTNNSLTSLKAFENLTNLHELYLRSNQIADINELRYLERLPLRILCLQNNPCCATAGPQYRRMVLQRIPSLEVLDYVPVQDAERRGESPSVRAVENVAASPQNNAIPDVVDRPRLPDDQQQQQAASSEQAQPEPCMPARPTAPNNVAQPESNFGEWSDVDRRSRRSQTPRRQLPATLGAAPLGGANEMALVAPEAPPSARARRYPSAPSAPRDPNLELWPAGPSNSQPYYSAAHRSQDFFVPFFMPQPREYERRRRNPLRLQTLRYTNEGCAGDWRDNDYAVMERRRRAISDIQEAQRQSELVHSIELIGQNLNRNAIEMVIDSLLRRRDELLND